MHMDVNGCQRTPLWVWSLMLLLALAVLPGAVRVAAQDRDPASKAQDQIVRKDKGPTRQKDGASPAVVPKESIAAQGDSVQADSVQADPASEVLSLRVYEIKGVLEKLNQAGGDQQAAEKRLLGMLPCSQVDVVPGGVDPRFAADRVKTENEGPRLYVDGDKLYVLDKEPIHRQVQSILEHGQQYGFEPVLIQASLMLIPLEKWSELEIAWGTPNRVHGQADDQGQQPSESPFAADVQADPLPRVAQRAPDIRPRVVANPNDAAPRSDDRSGLPLNPIRQASAATVIDENAALMVTFVDSDLTQKIIEGVPGSTVLSRPKVVTVNGRSATIEIGQLTPMVVDYKKVKDENGVERLEPIVQQVKLGTDMKLTPVVVDGRYVRLDFHLSVAWIGDRVPGPAVHVDGSAGLPPSAQARVASTIETALSVPLGANLAIGGLAMEQNGQPYRLLCMIRCDAVEPGDKPTP